MITVTLQLLSKAGLLLQRSPLHGPPQAPPTPVPHWVVLLVIVPALWVIIGGIVILIDQILQRI
ncbi:hypothetical protein C489_13306 [Natrinema versiforme JCM 10478]|uniref:Uncharacterized protein n=1 Tax=Natrinema versiforme JCM 10478 TaxID=1227496 RepID=L9XXV8_9EURY|nr:hypothetical protein C489_13306 [Natrinema versiforme JCM 10478]